jgi:hypothetical protein
MRWSSSIRRSNAETDGDTPLSEFFHVPQERERRVENTERFLRNATHLIGHQRRSPRRTPTGHLFGRTAPSASRLFTPTTTRTTARRRFSTVASEDPGRDGHCAHEVLEEEIRNRRGGRSFADVLD